MTQSDFNSYISAANNAISPFDLEIRSSYHQISRTRVFALVNSTSDPITQLATTHAADEISFLKRVLDAMFETYNTQRHEIMAITSMQAIQLAKAPTEDRRQTQNGIGTQGSTGQSLTQVQAEKMMNTLVEEGWFEKSQKGFYSLSPRALMELRGWLWETYNDIDDEEDEGDEEESVSKKIKLCFACKEIITTVRAQRQIGMVFRLKTCLGSAMSEEDMPMPTTRYMYTELLPNAAVEKMPTLQDRLDRQRLCWGESSRCTQA